jgi:hypothetical protein
MVGTMLFRAAVPVLDSVAAKAVEVVPDGVFGKLIGELRDAVVAAAPMETEVLVTTVNPLVAADNV